MNKQTRASTKLMPGEKFLDVVSNFKGYNDYCEMDRDFQKLVLNHPEAKWLDRMAIEADRDVDQDVIEGWIADVLAEDRYRAQDILAPYKALKSWDNDNE